MSGSSTTEKCPSDPEIEILEDRPPPLTSTANPPPPNPKPKKKKKKKDQQQSPHKPPSPPPRKTPPTSPPKSPTPPTPSPPPEEIMAALGVLTPFDPVKDDFEMWNGTFNNYLVANGMTEPKNADRCVGIFLSSVGINTYSLLSNLLAPDDLSSKKLSELQQTLKDHFKPAPKAISERFKFSKRTQKPGETVAAYVAALRTLAVYCKFTDLEVRIRDQFIFGILNESASYSPKMTALP